MECYIGQIQPFAFSFAPVDWALCHGTTLAVNQYQALFALLGTTFGGNGTTNFQLPDLQGRSVIGAGTAPFGTFDWGDAQGTNQIALTLSNLPTHTHTAVFTPSGGGGGTPLSVTVQANPATTGNSFAPSATNNIIAGSPSGNLGAQMWTNSLGSTPVTLGGVTVSGGGGGGGGTVTNGLTGSGYPFSLMNPSLALTFCIAMVGVFPTRG